MSCGGPASRLQCLRKNKLQDMKVCAKFSMSAFSTLVEGTVKMQTMETAPRDGTEILVYRPLAHLTGDRHFKVVRTTATPRQSPQGVEHYTESWCHPSHWAPLVVPSSDEWWLIEQDHQPLLREGYCAVAVGPRPGTWWVRGESLVASAHGAAMAAQPDAGPSAGACFSCGPEVA